MKKYTATIGSISHGTMRDEDLIPCFLNEIQRIDRKRITALRKDKDWIIITNWFKNHGDDDIRGCTKRLLAYHKKIGTASIATVRDPDRFYWSEYTNQLFEILNEYAPPYCYFGSSEGDGADYGFWTYHWSEIKQDTIDSETPMVSDSSELPKGHRGEWFQISDHGNVTLYVRNSKKQDKEIWGIV